MKFIVVNRNLGEQVVVLYSSHAIYLQSCIYLSHYVCIVRKNNDYFFRRCEPCLDDVGEIFLPLIRAEKSGSMGNSNISLTRKSQPTKV